MIRTCLNPCFKDIATKRHGQTLFPLPLDAALLGIPFLQLFDLFETVGLWVYYL